MRGLLVAAGLAALLVVVVPVVAEDAEACTVTLQGNGSTITDEHCGDEDQIQKENFFVEDDTGHFDLASTSGDMAVCVSGDEFPSDQTSLGDWCGGEGHRNLTEPNVTDKGKLQISYPTFFKENSSYHEKHCSEDRCWLNVTVGDGQENHIKGSFQVKAHVGAGFLPGPLWAWIAGGVLVSVMAGAGVVVYMRARAPQGHGDRSGSEGGAAVDASAQKGSTVTAEKKPVTVQPVGADGRTIREGVRVRAPEGKNARREGGAWKVPQAGARAYEIVVEADNHEPKKVTVKNQLGGRGTLKVQLSPKTGTVELEVTNVEARERIGGVRYWLRQGEDTVDQGTTRWETHTETDPVPFGVYKTVIALPDLFSVPSKEGKTESSHVAKRVQVPADGRVTVEFEIEPDLPALALPADLRGQLNQALENVRSYDAFLPTFFEMTVEAYGPRVRSLVEADLRIVLEDGLDPVRLAQAVQIGQQRLTEGIVDSISSRSNLSLFASTPQEGSPPSPKPLGVCSVGVLVDLDQARQAGEQLDQRLGELDEQLTRLSRDLTIRPLADLLKLGRGLLDEGTSARAPVEAGVHLLAADLVLGALDQAMNEETFRPHLDDGGL